MSAQKAYFQCPICGGLIEAFEPHDLPAPKVEGPPPRTPEEGIERLANAKLEQLMLANEQIILNHVQTQHTIEQVLVVAGRARNALQDIGELLAASLSGPDRQARIVEAINRGLGEE